MSSILKNKNLPLHKYWRLQDDIHARSKETDCLNFLSINCKGNEIHLLILDCCVNLNVFHFYPPVNVPALVPTYILDQYDSKYLWSAQMPDAHKSIYSEFGQFFAKTRKEILFYSQMGDKDSSQWLVQMVLWVRFCQSLSIKVKWLSTSLCMVIYLSPSDHIRGFHQTKGRVEFSFTSYQSTPY